MFIGLVVFAQAVIDGGHKCVTDDRQTDRQTSYVCLKLLPLCGAWLNKRHWCLHYGTCS